MAVLLFIGDVVVLKPILAHFVTFLIPINTFMKSSNVKLALYCSDAVLLFAIRFRRLRGKF